MDARPARSGLGIGIARVGEGAHRVEAGLVVLAAPLDDLDFVHAASVAKGRGRAGPNPPATARGGRDGGGVAQASQVGLMRLRRGSGDLRIVWEGVHSVPRTGRRTMRYRACATSARVAAGWRASAASAGRTARAARGSTLRTTGRRAPVAGCRRSAANSLRIVLAGQPQVDTRRVLHMQPLGGVDRQRRDFTGGECELGRCEQGFHDVLRTAGTGIARRNWLVHLPDQFSRHFRYRCIGF